MERIRPNLRKWPSFGYQNTLRMEYLLFDILVLNTSLFERWKDRNDWFCLDFAIIFRSKKQT